MIVRSINIAILTLVATAATCRDPAGPGPRVAYDLEHARALWEAAGPSSYRYEYRDVCFCAIRHFRATVVDGALEDVDWIRGEPGPGQDFGAESIDALFDRLAEALAGDPHDARMLFHPDLGYPVEVHVDPLANAIDEEWGFVIEHLRSLP